METFIFIHLYLCFHSVCNRDGKGVFQLIFGREFELCACMHASQEDGNKVWNNNSQHKRIWIAHV